MDSIIKSLIGKTYVDLFGQRLQEIFVPTFTEAERVVKKALIKLFRIWEHFFNTRILSPIAQAIDLERWEQELLTQTD